MSYPTRERVGERGVNIKHLLQHAKQELHSALEAEILLAFVLKQSRTYLLAHAERELTVLELRTFNELLARRLQREPIAYITGTKEFWSLPLFVTSDTLIPRPETELLIEKILTLYPHESPIKMADLGTGSGAIALAIAHERPHWEIYATDISENALQIARKNAQHLKLQNISFCHGNWCTALPCENFDVIASNPPYIAETEWSDYAQGLEFEPMHALLSGRDGLDAIHEITFSAMAFLKVGGYLLFEHGYKQGKIVRDLLIQAGFKAVETLNDLNGQERVTLGKKEDK